MTYRVVFHIDEMDKWILVQANCRNLLHALNDSELTIEIVANSEAVKFLVSDGSSHENETALSDLSHDKIIICACNNSLKLLDINPASLYTFVTVVPSGVGELTMKQHEGFAYIKP